MKKIYNAPIIRRSVFDKRHILTASSNISGAKQELAGKGVDAKNLTVAEWSDIAWEY